MRTKKTPRREQKKAMRHSCSNWKLAASYIRFYKKQAFLLFLGICMSALLWNGIASLLYSNRIADYEAAKAEYGSWGYRLKLPAGQGSLPAAPYSSDSYELAQAGFFSSCTYEDNMHAIQLCYGDEAYLEQTGRVLLEGSYPQKRGEIALDYYALHNLDADSSLGSALDIGGKTYVLTGILSEGATEEGNPLMAFLGKSDSQAMEMDSYWYLTFSGKSRAYAQFSAFLKERRISRPEWEMNEGLAGFIGAEPPESILTVFCKALKLPKGKLIYLLGTLENNNRLLHNMVLAILFLFGAFIISSIFRVMTEKRMAQYGILEALGIPEKNQFASLFLELLMLFVPAYLAGGLLGNLMARLLYQGNFCIDAKAIGWGCGAFLCYLCACCLSTVRAMRKYTQAEKIKRPLGKRSRSIVSRKHHNMLSVLNLRFLLEKRKNFLGVVVSLSLGGVLFLCTNYVRDNAIENNIHAMQTDLGLYADIQAAIEEPDLGKTIPQEIVGRIKKDAQNHVLEGLEEISPISYTLGEIPLKEGVFQWTEFYPEAAERPLPDEKPDPEIMERCNGIATRTEDGGYRIKANVYGYEPGQFQDLSDYVLEGTLYPEEMAQQNQIVFKTIMDGGGYYDGIDLHPGDKITLKVPKAGSLQADPDLLKFQSDNSHYIEQEFTIAAVVSRCLGENDAFIGSGSSVAGIILPQQLMEKSFGICDYQNVNIRLSDQAGSQAMVKALRPYFSGLSKCVLHDFTGDIQRKHELLIQKTYFFYGIAAILFFVSLLHAANSMEHQILARRYEYGVLRAMGVTEQNFRQMLIRQGAFYGLAATAFMTLLLLICQSILGGVLQHVVRYIIVNREISLLSLAAMASLNIAVCILAMLACARKLLRENIVEEVKR